MAAPSAELISFLTSPLQDLPQVSGPRSFQVLPFTGPRERCPYGGPTPRISASSLFFPEGVAAA